MRFGNGAGSICRRSCGSGRHGALAQDNADKPACEQFTWSIKREQALFADPNIETVFSGATLSGLPLHGVALELQPHATVEYVLHPGREPKTPESNGGILSISNNPKAGRYQVTLSGEAWLDIIQNGKELAAAAHSGRRDCADVRKSVQFDLESGPLTIQVSGAAPLAIKLAILPVEQAR